MAFRTAKVIFFFWFELQTIQIGNSESVFYFKSCFLGMNCSEEIKLYSQTVNFQLLPGLLSLQRHLRGGEPDGIQVRAHIRRRPQSISAPWNCIRTCLYTTLGLASNASVAEIQSACSHLSLCPPGNNQGDRGVIQGADARRACTLLLDLRLRAYYDSHRRQILAAGRRRTVASRLQRTNVGNSSRFEAWARSGKSTGGGCDSIKKEPPNLAEPSVLDLLMRRPAGVAAPSPPAALLRPHVSQSAFDVMMRRRSTSGAQEQLPVGSHSPVPRATT
jgi:hypothetical protein